MIIQENVPLKPRTAFKIGGVARFFVEINTADEIPAALQLARSQRLPVFVLGGGSNLLVSDEGFDGLVIHVINKGLDVLQEDNVEIILKVAAGETWDNVVDRTVRNGWWGIENLSLIPGYAGAAAVQNIGAYGQELSDVLDDVEVYDRHDEEYRRLTADECELGYRTSIFNNTCKGRYLILQIALRLRKNGCPNISYPDVSNYFASRINKPRTVQELRNAIIAIRTAKLPNPVEVGNAGSFFKNPVLNGKAYRGLESQLADHFGEDKSVRLQRVARQVPGEPCYKVPAAFLIEICGLKGACHGGAMISGKQPNVIVNNTGTATAEDVLALFRKIRQEVYRKTGVQINSEPELVGFTQEHLAAYFRL